jgi:VWFA-related protein
MPRRKSLLVAIILLRALFLGQQAETQQTPQSPSRNAPAQRVPENHSPPQELAKLSTHTDLVLVPVLVTSAGKHVPGLQKDAFRIEENGKTRSISVFEEVTTEKLPTRHREDSPGVYSNFLAPNEQPWRLTAVVLDMIDTPAMRQADAKKQLIDYLLRSASREEPMAIFGLSGSGLRQLHPFTRDTTVLISALQALKLSLSSEERTQPPEVFTDDPSQEQASDEEQLPITSASRLGKH